MKIYTYHLAKSDPSEYSLLDLARDSRTVWSGVKNPQALAAIRSMQKGDCVLVYHSQGQSAIVGWAWVASPPRPDPSSEKLTVIDFAYGGALSTPLTLQEIKDSGLFPDFALVRQSRLSTMPVPLDFIAWLKKQRHDFRPVPPKSL